MPTLTDFMTEKTTSEVTVNAMKFQHFIKIYIT